jgi:outer membrane lipoprotein-sorting protein
LNLPDRHMRRRRRRCRIAVLAVLAGFLAGCSTALPPLPTEVSTRQWKTDELVQALKERAERFQSVRALAQVEYAGPEGKKGFQEAILIQRPDEMRLETLSLLGAIMIVTVNKNEITGYLPRDDAFLRGQPSSENLRRLMKIPVPLDVNEVTALLLGLPPVNIDKAAAQGGNSLTFPAPGDGNDTVTFATDQPAPSQWERRDARGESQISVRFADYMTTSAGLFPARISIESAAQKRRLDIRYQEPELNGKLPADLFSQKKPADVKELPIEALGG